jgi:hypothetical protein
VELKTANTNWRAEGILNITRPITKNVSGIAEDILALRQKCPPAHGFAAFCIFPIPLRLWQNTREQLDYHLRHIEEMSGLPESLLVQRADYVEVTDNFGICAFVVEVT